MLFTYMEVKWVSIRCSDIKTRREQEDKEETRRRNMKEKREEAER
jgi:hypothetical protein